MGLETTNRVKVVTVGGGTGQSILLRGLKRYADRIEITAIVTTFDDGGSSGALTREFGVPALGDIRRCVAALLDENEKSSNLAAMLEHRFVSGGALHNHSLGNLMFLAAWQRTGNLTEAIASVAPPADMLGTVLPVSERYTTLRATLPDGTGLSGESEIGRRNQDLFGKSNLYLDPPIDANPQAINAIKSAQYLILSPGDLFTSVLPNLLPNGVAEAIEQSSAEVVQICNVAMKQGETRTYSAADFGITANRYLNVGKSGSASQRRVQTMFVNQSSGDVDEPDIAIVEGRDLDRHVDTILTRPMSDPSKPALHDPHKLASAIVGYIDRSRA